MSSLRRKEKIPDDFFARCRVASTKLRAIPSYAFHRDVSPALRGLVCHPGIIARALEHAVALQRTTPQASAAVAPTPSSLVAVQPNKAVKDYVVYLPSDVKEWTCPVVEFVRLASAAESTVRVVQPSLAALEDIGKEPRRKGLLVVLQGKQALNEALEDELNLGA